MGELFVR
jgi:hypothetical protein